MRLKALLIDDETKILANLSRVVPWDELGIDIAGLARNGAHALEIAKAERPDIVLLDIRMPVMDGIAFLEAFAAAGLEAEIVMLTGYQDFEYARSVIRFGVREYLLKPIDYDELTAVIERLAASVRVRRRERSRAERQYGRAAELAYEKLLYDVLMGYAAPAPHALPHGMPDGGERPAEAIRFGMLLAEIDDDAGRFIGASEAERRLWNFAVRNVMQDALSAEGLRHAVLQTRDGELCALVEFAEADGYAGRGHGSATCRGSGRGDGGANGACHAPASGCGAAPAASMDAAATLADAMADALAELADRLRQAVLTHARIGLSIAVHPALLPLPDLPAAYRRLQRELLLASDKRQPVIVCGDRGAGGAERSGAFWEPVERLAGALRQRSREAVEQAVRGLTEHMRAAAAESPARAVRLGQFAALHLLREMREVGALTPAQEQEIWRMTEQADRAKDVIAVIRRIADDSLAFAAARKTSDALMDAAEAYIRRHLSRDFGIDEVASSIGISASYFSLLFKQRFGCTFVAYVTNERIEMAKSMLLLTDRSVTDIGRAVGYAERRYFTRVFQKLTGEIPSEYRARRRRGG